MAAPIREAPRLNLRDIRIGAVSRLPHLRLVVAPQMVGGGEARRGRGL